MDVTTEAVAAIYDENSDEDFVEDNQSSSSSDNSNVEDQDDQQYLQVHFSASGIDWHSTVPPVRTLGRNIINVPEGANVNPTIEVQSFLLFINECMLRTILRLTDRWLRVRRTKSRTESMDCCLLFVQEQTTTCQKYHHFTAPKRAKPLKLAEGSAGASNGLKGDLNPVDFLKNNSSFFSGRVFNPPFKNSSLFFKIFIPSLFKLPSVVFTKRSVMKNVFLSSKSPFKPLLNHSKNILKFYLLKRKQEKMDLSYETLSYENILAILKEKQKGNTTRDCNYCKITKPLTEFHMANDFALSTKCKSCKKEYNKKRYQFLKNNPDYKKRKITKIQTITIIADDMEEPIIVDFKECTKCCMLKNVSHYRIENRLSRLIVSQCNNCEKR